MAVWVEYRLANHALVVLARKTRLPNMTAWVEAR